jgi:hypothetical protein
MQPLAVLFAREDALVEVNVSAQILVHHQIFAPLLKLQPPPMELALDVSAAQQLAVFQSKTHAKLPFAIQALDNVLSKTKLALHQIHATPPLAIPFSDVYSLTNVQSTPPMLAL